MLRIQLKRLRELKGKSQQEFAADIGVAQSAVGNWESGTREPGSLELLEKIADYFGVSTDFLLGRTDQQEKPIPEDGDGRKREFIHLYEQLPDEEKSLIIRQIKGLLTDQ